VTRNNHNSGKRYDRNLLHPAALASPDCALSGNIHVQRLAMIRVVSVIDGYQKWLWHRRRETEAICNG
jgi:hypothetical protein